MEYIGLQDSINIVRKFLMQHISDGKKPCAILGFSQGATFCHILSMLASASKMENGDDCDDLEVIRPFQMIKCAMLLSGFPSMHDGKLLTSNINIGELDIKSLHIFGEKDTSVPKSFGDKLANRFVNPETYDHGKGHVIPHNADFCERVIKFVDSCLVE